MALPRFGYGPTEAADRIRDVDTLRQFISGQGPVALLDLPWMPIYLIFIYLLHPMLALLVMAGALLLFSMTVITEFAARRSGGAIQRAAVARATLAESHVRNVEVLRAMGITGISTARFENANSEHLRLQMSSSDLTGTMGALSKVIRMVLQSAVLGLGAYFTILGELSAGAIIAASVASAGLSTVIPGIERIREISSKHWWDAPSSPTVMPAWVPTTLTFKPG